MDEKTQDEIMMLHLEYMVFCDRALIQPGSKFDFIGVFTGFEAPSYPMSVKHFSVVASLFVTNQLPYKKRGNITIEDRNGQTVATSTDFTVTLHAPTIRTHTHTVDFKDIRFLKPGIYTLVLQMEDGWVAKRPFQCSSASA